MALNSLTLLCISPPSISRIYHHSKPKLGTHQTLTPHPPFLPILNPFFLLSLPPFFLSSPFWVSKIESESSHIPWLTLKFSSMTLPTTKLTSGLPWWLSGKESACQCRFDPWVRKIPWRKWQPTPVFLHGKFLRRNRGAWWAIVHGVGKSWTRLSD